MRPFGDLAAARACFEEYGVVGVTGVLSPEECQALIKEGIEPFLPEGCHMNEEETFALADRELNRYGVIGKTALFNRALLHARLHPNVVTTYQALYGREDVVACHDRAAWMRPKALSDCWDTPFNWPGLHVDVNLKSFFGDHDKAKVDEFLGNLNYASGGGFVGENNAKHVSMGATLQGVLNLFDNEDEDGGFQCVPGMFGARLQAWVQQHPNLPEAQPNGRYDFKGFGPDAEVGAEAVRLPCPAGTLIVFDATLPHGTRPNSSACSRAILFLRYIHGDALPAKAWKERGAALRQIAAKAGFAPAGGQARHLFGPER